MLKLHSSFLNMLLHASSIDGGRAAKEITSVCRSFFNQETAGLDDQQFLVLFRYLGFQDVGSAHGFVQAFLSRYFLYHEPGCPNNFSIFCFYEKLRDALDNKRRLLMHLKSKYGKAKGYEEINDSLRQVVVVPSNFTKIKERIKIFGGLNQMFFGKEAKTTEAIWDFYKLIKKNESALKHKCNDDDMGSTNTVDNAQPSTTDSTDVLRQLMEGIYRQNERIEDIKKLTR